MGILGTRRQKLQGEKPVYTSVDEILEDARKKGLINEGCLDIEALIREKDINIERLRLDSSISGRLRKENGKWTITINANHSEKRQRFTLAHELAHYYLHKEFKDDFSDEEIFYRNEESGTLEYAANRFASDLLINPSDLKKLIKSGVVLIDEIASHFNVSPTAVKIQLSRLGYRIK